MKPIAFPPLSEDYRPVIARLTTEAFTRPSPGPAWARTGSRRRRSGSRRVKRLTRRLPRTGPGLPVYYRFGDLGWDMSAPIYLGDLRWTTTYVIP